MNKIESLENSLYVAGLSIDQLTSRIAALEAERDGAVRMLDVSQLILNEKMERITALEEVVDAGEAAVKELEAERDAERRDLEDTENEAIKLRDDLNAHQRDLANAVREVEDRCEELSAARQRVAELEEGGKLLVADILSRISEIAALEAERDRLREVLEKVDGELTDLQPHIPQACYPGHERFIDTHVDAAQAIIRAALVGSGENDEHREMRP